MSLQDIFNEAIKESQTDIEDYEENFVAFIRNKKDQIKAITQLDVDFYHKHRCDFSFHYQRQLDLLPSSKQLRKLRNQF